MIDVGNNIITTSDVVMFAQPARRTPPGMVWRRLLAEFIGTFLLDVNSSPRNETNGVH